MGIVKEKVNDSAQKSGQRVKALRKRLGLNQEDFAAEVGYGRTVISETESGTRVPKVAFWEKIKELEARVGIAHMEEKSVQHEASEGVDHRPQPPSTELTGEFPDLAYGARAKLKAARLEHHLSVAQLAKKMGNCHAGYLQALEERGVRISERVAQRLCQVLPELELDDLLGGSDVAVVIGQGATTMGTPAQTLTTGGLVARKVPVISMAQAGELTTWEDIYDYEGVETYAVKDPKAIAVRIRGDSMSPDYKEGTVAILYPSVTPRTEHLVVAKLRDGSVLFKRLHLTDSQYHFISSNPAYPPIVKSKEQIEWIYPVGKTERDEL